MRMGEKKKLESQYNAVNVYLIVMTLAEQ